MHVARNQSQSDISKQPICINPSLTQRRREQIFSNFFSSSQTANLASGRIPVSCPDRFSKARAPGKGAGERQRTSKRNFSARADFWGFPYPADFSCSQTILETRSSRARGTGASGSQVTESCQHRTACHAVSKLGRPISRAETQLHTLPASGFNV